MHRCTGRAERLAPGLTPLTGVYSRGGKELWACYRRDVPQLSYITDHDASDAETYCVKSHTVADVVKLTYYGIKLYDLLKNSGVPPP